MKSFKLSPAFVAAIASLNLFGLQAQQVDFFGITKVQVFEQSNDSFAALLQESFNGKRAFEVNAFADGSGPSAITGAVLGIPGHDAQSLVIDSQDSRYWNLDASFDAKPDMDDQFPSGTYTFTFQTSAGQQVGMVDLTGDTYPNVPFVTNWSETQLVDPAAPFTLHWQPFTGGTTDDFIQVTVLSESGNQSNEVHISPEPGEMDALDGTSVQYTIPMNVMGPGATYTLKLSFFHLIDSDMSLGGNGVAAYGKETRLDLRTMGGSDITAPSLRNSSPNPGSGNVPTTSAVRFIFNEPMDTSVDPGQTITWIGIANPNNFTYVWDSEGTSLYCSYPPALPTGTTISWTINQALGTSGNPVQFIRDLAGNPLPTMNGNFTTAANATTGADVIRLRVIKAETFFQADATPTPREDFLAIFEAELNGLNTVSSLKVTAPNNVGPFEIPREEYGDNIDGEAHYTSKTDLDRFFGNGDYKVDISGFHDGAQSVTLSAPSDAYPSTPTILNIAAAQAVDPTQDFTISWQAFSGAGAGDFIELSINNEYDNEVFETPTMGEAGAQPGTATSIVIPAGTLPPGRELRVGLAFIRSTDLDTSSYSGVQAAAVFAKQTSFKLTTTGNPIRPSLGPITAAPGVPPSFTVYGERNLNYVVEGTDTFDGWQVVGGSQAYEEVLGEEAHGQSGLGSFYFSDSMASGFLHRFYRAREGSQSGGMGGDPTFQFNFLHFATSSMFPGGAGPSYTPALMGSYSINNFSPNVVVENDSNFAMVNEVSFTGPNGSGVNQLPASAQNSSFGGNQARYQTVAISSPPTGTGGTWIFNYRGTDHTFNVSDPDANNRLVILLPTVTTSGGIVQSVSWQYRAAGDGSLLNATQAGQQGHINHIQVQINYLGNPSGYSSNLLTSAAMTDNGPASANISWSNVTAVHMTYNDDLDNAYIVTYIGPASQ